MELILHIGMGKTGSSAIQKALGENRAALKDQGVAYLGMWMDADVGAADRPSYHDFFLQPDSVWQSRARELGRTLQKQRMQGGPSRFVVSNESFFHHPDRFHTFIQAFRDFGTVRAVAYARNPMKWLPSAYSQWGIRHKTVKGPIPRYGELARRQVRQYQEVIRWQELMPDLLTLRPYDQVGDVVQDFLAVIGVSLDLPEERFYARAEPAESVLRAFYNGCQEEQVLPRVFDSIVGRDLPARVPRIDDVVRDSLDYTETAQIVDENRDLFDRFSRMTGIDLLSGDVANPSAPDVEALRDRVVDYLVELTLAQARRLKVLENRLKKLEGRGPGADSGQ